MIILEPRQQKENSRKTPGPENLATQEFDIPNPPACGVVAILTTLSWPMNISEYKNQL